MEQRLESDWPGKRREAIDALTSPLLTKYTRIGIVVGIIENGRTAIFGYGKIGEVSSLTPDGTTLFEIGSITKVFTFSANLGRFSTPLRPALDLCQQIQIERPIPQSYLLGIGLGWHISLFQEGESFMHWHNGGTGGYRSFMGFTRDYACGVVILTNYGLGINPEIDTIGSEVLRVLASGSSATQE